MPGRETLALLCPREVLLGQDLIILEASQMRNQIKVLPKDSFEEKDNDALAEEREAGLITSK